MSEDKHLEEKEKLEAEISRSLSVVKMKEVHKQIEDIEKLRKQATIKSICKRISYCTKISEFLVKAVKKAEEKVEDQKLNFELTLKIKVDGFTSEILKSITKIYESIYFDFQKTLDIKKEDLDRLFPKVELDFTTYESIVPNLISLCMQLSDMKNYCLRLL